MPKNTRWTLNPRKWFGMKLKAGHKLEGNPTIVGRVPPPPTAATTTRTVLTTSTIPRIFSGKNQMKVIPMSLSNDLQRENSTITQLQLPAFSIRRERTSTTLRRQKTFHPTHTEPTIRKNSRIEEGLSIDTTRLSVPIVTSSIYDNFEETSPFKQADMSVSNMSNRCLINYPRHVVDQIEEYSLPSRSSSTSSIMEENDRSSSSGIFTDERQHTPSKGTLSTLEVLSVESIADSQRSFNHSQTRPIIHHYRRPMSVFETIEDNKPEQRQTSLIRSHRSHSVEGIFNDNQINSTCKSRQSSVAIIKQIEKRFPTSRSPSASLEKPGFIRITNDTYRLTTDPSMYPPRKNSINSFVPYANYDDSLRSANDEECYARLPRTSSTEQLNHTYLQHDLRMIVNECIRPMVVSHGKTRPMKTFQRYKRPQPQSQLNIENITDKLLSSIDYSIYRRYERCN